MSPPDLEKEHRRAEAVRIDKTPHEVFHGFHITDNQALEAHRLGIREDLYERYRRWFPNTPLRDLPVNERINDRIRTRASEIVSERKRRQGFFRSRWIAGRGFLRNIRNVFRTNSGLIEEERRERYGTFENVHNRRLFLADRLWTTLSHTQRAAVTAQLAVMGLAGTPPINAISDLNVQQLEILRHTFDFFRSPSPGPLFPPRRDFTPLNVFKELEEFVQIEGEERKKALSTTVYDPQRLQNFLDTIEGTTPDLYNALVNILEENALFQIENNPEAQALLAYLDSLANNPPGSTPDYRHLTNLLNNISNRLPSSEDSESNENTEDIRQATNIANSFESRVNTLNDKYLEANNKGQQIWDTRVQYNRLPPLAPHVPDSSHKTLLERINTLNSETSSLTLEINKLEREFMNECTKYLDILNGIRTISATQPQINTLNVSQFNLNLPAGLGVPYAESTNDEILGETVPPPPPLPARAPATPSNFRIGLSTFSRSFMRDIVNETRNYDPSNSREKVSCRQLLFLLKEQDLHRHGVTNAEQRAKYSLLSTNLLISEVENEALRRQSNQLLADRRAGTTLGMNWLDRVRKNILSNITGGIFDNRFMTKVYKPNHLIDHVSGFDKEFSMFKNMRTDVTLTELRDIIDKNGGISSNKLFEFSTKLREVFIGFKMLGEEGKVTLFDRDSVTMENLINNLLLIRAELRSRKFIDDIRSQGIKGNKAHLILQKIREDEKAQREEENSLLSELSPIDSKWKQLFSRKVLAREYGDRYAEARKYIKDNKLRGRKRRQYLDSEGLTTVDNTLGTQYALKEWTAKTKKGLLWAGGKTKSAGRKVLVPTYEYGVKKPFQTLIWKPTKWTAKTAGKVVAFPFVLVGSLVDDLWKWSKGK